MALISLQLLKHHALFVTLALQVDSAVSYEALLATGSIKSCVIMGMTCVRFPLKLCLRDIHHFTFATQPSSRFVWSVRNSVHFSKRDSAKTCLPLTSSSSVHFHRGICIPLTRWGSLLPYTQHGFPHVFPRINRSCLTSRQRVCRS
jgi:hypothetical protein